MHAIQEELGKEVGARVEESDRDVSTLITSVDEVLHAGTHVGTLHSQLNLKANVIDFVSLVFRKEIKFEAEVLTCKQVLFELAGAAGICER